MLFEPTMNCGLLREFEEMEGLAKEALMGSEMEIVEDEMNDYDATSKPTAASTLSSSDIYYEMEKRSLKSTGFPDTDREILQKAFNQEFMAKLDEERAESKERKRRAAQQAGLQRRLMLMEQTLKEEQDALAADHQVGIMIDLIKQNIVKQSIRIDLNSITARSLAKAMLMNNTITCLELSSHNLNDHAGSYIARTLIRNTTLKKIELDNNNLGLKSLLAFGESLKLNKSLVYLSLDSNPIFSSTTNDVKGITALCDALRSNTTLTSLNLWRTGLRPIDGELLSNTLCHNTSLLFLDISHNNVEMKHARNIADKLDANLAAYEASERILREDALTDQEREGKIRDIKNAAKEELELQQWLEDRRNQRAETKRIKEEKLVIELQKLAEIQKKQIAIDKANEIKEKADAADKKAKKDKTKKSKK